MISPPNLRVMLVTLLLAVPAAVRADVDLEALEEQAFKQAAALAAPSVVRIQTVGGLDVLGQMVVGTGPTSGVIVSADGYIISSAFNFAAKPSSILVELPDERRLPAELVAVDRSKMLALLKIEAEGLPVSEAAPRESVRVGHWAIALGRGYDTPQPGVSVGIVSALHRIWGRAIQTDAKVSPLNYGGPLVDVEGRVTGILVPLSPEGTGEAVGVEWYDSGIGFAIPMEDVLEAAERLKGGEDLRPGLMGIDFQATPLHAGEPAIERVRVDSPAARAGLKAGDVITRINGRDVKRQGDVRHILGSRYAGDEITVTLRRGEESVEATLSLVAEIAPYEFGFLGILPAREAEDEAPGPGVGVRYVYPDGPAAAAGLAVRDRILRFNGTDVQDAAQLADLAGRTRPDEAASVDFTRDGAEQTVEVTIGTIPNAVPDELRTSPIAPPGDEAARPETGRLTIELPAHERSYWAYVPEDYNPDARYGLMVWIHPGGDTMEAALLREWKSVCDRRGMLIIGPRAGRVGGWNPNEAEFVKEAVEDFQQKYAVDPARVFLHGHADGGAFAWHLAFRHRDVFRGAAVSAAALRSPPPENDPQFRQQFHLVCGDQHPALPQVQATARGLERLKFPVTLREVADHQDRYPPTEQIEEIGRWADALDRL